MWVNLVIGFLLESRSGLRETYPFRRMSNFAFLFSFFFFFESLCCFNGGLSGEVSNKYGAKSAFNTERERGGRERERESMRERDGDMSIYIFLLFTEEFN